MGELIENYLRDMAARGDGTAQGLLDLLSKGETPRGDLEGYHTASVTPNDDCDYGPCTGYEIAELGLEVFLYRDHPNTISFHRP